jgi:hypothetical protein
MHPSCTGVINIGGAALSVFLIAARPAYADNPIDLTAPQTIADASASPAATTTSPPPEVNGLAAYFANWSARVTQAEASQPEWASPLVTTNPILEERYRFDVPIQHVGNGSDTTNVDGSKGLDLIVGPTQEIQLGTPPYIIHSTPTGKGDYSGWGDYPVFRFKQRLLSSPQDEDNYVVSAWLQIQAPIGIEKATNHAVTLLPTIGFGKGFGNFSILGNFGAVIPTAYEGKLGTQVTNNIALEYRIFHYFTPELEFNNTYYSNGTRNGRDQLFITPGLIIGRLPLAPGLGWTIAVGYETAITPKYQASPLLPAYDHAWLLSTRFAF